MLFEGTVVSQKLEHFFEIFFMATSWVALSIKNIKTQASREMTSRKNIKMFDFNGVNVAKHSHVAGARYLPSLIALFDICIAYSSKLRMTTVVQIVVH